MTFDRRRSRYVDYILHRALGWRPVPRVNYIDTRYIYQSNDPLLVDKLVRGYDLNEVPIDEILLCDSYRHALKNFRMDLIALLIPDIDISTLTLTDLDNLAPIDTILDIILDEQNGYVISDRIVFVRDGLVIDNEKNNERKMMIW